MVFKVLIVCRLFILSKNKFKINILSPRKIWINQSTILIASGAIDLSERFHNLKSPREKSAIYRIARRKHVKWTTRDASRPPGWRSRNSSGHRSPIVAAFVHQFKVKSASPPRGSYNFHGPKYIPSLIYKYTFERKPKKKCWRCVPITFPQTRHRPWLVVEETNRSAKNRNAYVRTIIPISFFS